MKRRNFHCSIVMRRGMKEWITTAVVVAQRAGAQGSVGSIEAMTDTARWLVHWTIDCQRARNVVLPNHSDSPAVVYAMLNLTTTLAKWMGWESTPTLQLAPKFSLCDLKCAIPGPNNGDGVGSDGHPRLPIRKIWRRSSGNSTR